MGENVETVRDFIFLGSKITADGDCSHKIKRYLLLERKLWPTRQHIKKQRHYFANKGPYSQGYGFSCSHVWMWELGHKEGWVLKNWCFWTVMLEKTWESLGQQGDQTSPILREVNLNIHWKDWCWSWSSNTLATWCKWLTHWERPWCWERLRAGGEGGNRQWDSWMALLTRWTGVWATPGDSEGQGRKACWGSWGRKESDMT